MSINNFLAKGIPQSRLGKVLQNHKMLFSKEAEVPSKKYNIVSHKRHILDNKQNYIVSNYAKQNNISIIDGYDVNSEDLHLMKKLVKNAINIYAGEKLARGEKVDWSNFDEKEFIFIANSFDKKTLDQYRFYVNGINTLCFLKNKTLYPYFPTRQSGALSMPTFELSKRSTGDYFTRVYPICNTNIFRYKPQDIVNAFRVSELLFIADDINNNPKLFYQRPRYVFQVI